MPAPQPTEFIQKWVRLNDSLMVRMASQPIGRKKRGLQESVTSDASGCAHKMCMTTSQCVFKKQKNLSSFGLCKNCLFFLLKKNAEIHCYGQILMITFTENIFLNTTSMPSTLLRTLCIFHLILPTTQWGRHRCSIHSAEVENDTEFDSSAFNP